VESTLQHLFLVRNSLIKINGEARLDPNITIGDGIGAEVSESVREIFKADNVPIEWEQVDVSGVESGDKHSEELFRESVASLKRNKIGLKGMTKKPS
jgi:isocitrate/isopropylmalate dehydrogenase